MQQFGSGGDGGVDSQYAGRDGVRGQRRRSMRQRRRGAPQRNASSTKLADLRNGGRKGCRFERVGRGLSRVKGVRRRRWSLVKLPDCPVLA